MSWRSSAFIATGAFLPAMGAFAAFLQRRALPRTRGEFELAGLQDKVRIDYDQWGVPHILSHSLQDALFTQGFVTAQDRMIQLELFRRIASGRVAEVMGKRAIGIDIFMRRMDLRGTATRIAQGLPDDTKRYLESYGAGVNAYVGGKRRVYPLDLLLLAGGRPRHWTIEDSLLTLLFFNWTMDATWTADLMRGRLTAKLGSDAAKMLLPSHGPGNVPVIQYGEGESRATAVTSPDSELDFFPWNENDPSWFARKVFVHAQGSNNWVLSGSKTVSGKPLLCNDPHVQHTVPTMFYLCHIKSEEPACDVIGATLPGIPGMLMGRNEKIAWGATSLIPDVVDLYIETFEDADSLRYRVGNKWEEAESREEEIKVLPGRVVRRRIVTTRHGPVIARVDNKALALKWVGHDPDNDSAGCFVRMGLAGDWKGFAKSLEGYSGPALNLVYADTQGNIAYTAAGRIPLRDGHDGSLPLAGEEESYDWKGYIPIQELPRVANPERGWIATANNQVVDEGYPHVITTMWEPSCRQARIAELLEGGGKHDIADMRAMQGDVLTGHGRAFRRELLRACEGREDLDLEAAKALKVISEWDGRAEKESVGQSLYFMSWRVLTERLLRHRLGNKLYFEYASSYFNVNHAVEAILSGRSEQWLPPSASSFEELLLQCLEEAIVRLQARFGGKAMEGWKWGRLHSLEIPHLLGSMKPLGRILNLGPVPLEGDGETVRCAMPESDPTVQVLARSSMGGSSDLQFLPRFHSDRGYAGPVFRMIVDLSEGGGSLWCLDVGQCSNPLSRFYRNFFTLWHEVDYVPMAFREEEVREVTHTTLTLKPGRWTDPDSSDGPALRAPKSP